jgi:hypothetical protein
MHTVILDERPSRSPAAGRLGRHVRHDPRSRAYGFSGAAVSELRSVVHRRLVPVFDQGAVGSCTGNAILGALGTDPFYGTIPDDHPRRPTGDADHDEELAVQLYSEATRLDDVRGVYPPTDTGSSGLGVCKAAKAAGLISGYQHAFSLEAALRALVLRPVIVGTVWLEAFDSPDADGTIAVPAHGIVDAEVRGGHEYVLDEIDVERQRVGATNSWGASYGADGRMYLSFADLGTLLAADGDCTVPVPLDQPTPTPDTKPGAPIGNGCLPFASLLSRFAWKDHS